MKKYIIDEKILNTTLQVLGKLPAEQVFDLILAIKQQAKEYVEDEVKKKK